MSLRKWCGCPDSPKCDHDWFYDFRVNRRRYRASTDTSNKQQAKDIEARERSRILEGRHGIRRQPDITFKDFGKVYLRDHADLNTRSADRTRAAIDVLNRTFGALILHEITTHRIEQWKRERLGSKWKAHNQKSAAKPVRPATVNRELDALRGMLNKAVEWHYILESPVGRVKRLRVENARTRILTPAEQAALIDASPRKLRIFIALALITGARIGELLALRWEDCTDGALTFWKTKNGRVRRVEITPSIAALLAQLPKAGTHLFMNKRTQERLTENGVRHVFNRAVERAGLSDDVTPHTLRHTALSRMIAAGFDDYTVMSISGHSSTRMLARYTHPTAERRAGALGVSTLSVPTAGNAGCAMAAYAARAGLEAQVFMPSDVKKPFRLECESYGATVTLVDGLITDAGRIAAERGRPLGWYDVSTLKEPYRLEGKKTMGFELAEQLGWRWPDVVVYPTGGGTGLIGMWKAFEELEAIGWVEPGRRPRMISVQAEGCAPVVRAFHQGRTSAESPERPHTIADGLRVPRAIGDFLMLRILRDSGGTAVAVSDQAMVEGMRQLGGTEGISAAPEGGATVAALEQLVSRGLVRPDEVVVLFNTGGALKYLEVLG